MRQLHVFLLAVLVVAAPVTVLATGHHDDAGSGRDAGESRSTAVEVFDGNTYTGTLNGDEDDDFDGYILKVPAGHAISITFDFLAADPEDGSGVQVDLRDPDGTLRDFTAVWHTATLGPLDAVGLPAGEWFFLAAGGFTEPVSYTFTVDLIPMDNVEKTVLPARHLSIIDIQPPEGAYSIVETRRSDRGGPAGEANRVLGTSFLEHPEGETCGAAEPSSSYEGAGSVLGGIGVHHDGTGLSLDPLNGRGAPPTAWVGGYSGTSGIRSVSVMASPDPFTATIYAAWNDDAPLTVATPAGAATFVHAWQLDGEGTGYSLAGRAVIDDLGADLQVAGPSSWVELDARRPADGVADPHLTLDEADGDPVLDLQDQRDTALDLAPGAHRLTVEHFDGTHDGRALATLLDIPVEMPWNSRDCTVSDVPWVWQFKD